jgi:hypothetical protein
LLSVDFVSCSETDIDSACTGDSETCTVCVAGTGIRVSDKDFSGVDPSGGVSSGDTSTVSALLSAVDAAIGGDVGGVASVTNGVCGTGCSALTCSPGEGGGVGPPRGNEGTEGAADFDSNDSLSCAI